jgi:hypothetical protein
MLDVPLKKASTRPKGRMDAFHQQNIGERRRLAASHRDQARR